ncbi:MAG: hypothetical protein ACOCZ2_03430 [Thermodesulfobacteriota bacterium]
MSNQASYRKLEQEIIPSYRDRLNKAESSEDVKKFFNYAAQELFKKIFSNLDLDYEDISLDPDSNPSYALSEKIRNNPDFISTLNNSDLNQILDKLAESALNRYKHLEKHPERTNAKIRN